MRMKIMWTIALTMVLIAIGTSGTIERGGRHILLANDTIPADSSWVSDYFNIHKYPNVSALIRTTNDYDSTVYRLVFLTAYDSTGTTFYFYDTSGTLTGANTLFNIADSASTWLFTDVDVGNGRYGLLNLITDATDHGDSVAFWLELYLREDK